MLVPVLIKGDEEGDRWELGTRSACVRAKHKVGYALKVSFVF